MSLRWSALLFPFLAGCASRDSLEHYVGRDCIVRVRPDVLGKSGDMPMSLETDSVNGAQVSTFGKLLSVDERWVTIQKPNGGPEILVARDAVLSVAIEPL